MLHAVSEPTSPGTEGAWGSDTLVKQHEYIPIVKGHVQVPILKK